MDFADKIVVGVMGLAIVTLMFVVVILLPDQLDRESRAKDIAIESGCTYLGHARDLNTVFFFDCAGTIVMKRVK